MNAPLENVSVPPSAPRVRDDLISPDPLLDCLIEVARLHGQGATRASLSAGLPLQPQEPLPLALAERAAARAGLATRVQRLALAQIDALTLPAILILQDNKACVLLGREGEAHWRILLPETGQGAITLTTEALQARFTGVVLFARPHFRFDERTPEVKATRSGHWFWGPVLAQRFVYRDVLWAALLINLFALAFPIFSMNVYDRVVPNHATETLWVLAIGVTLVLCSDLFIRLLRSHFVDEASARIDVQISATLMERVLGMRLENRPQSVGSFAANLRGFEQVRDFIASSTVTALIDLPFALLFVGVMAWISPWLVLPVVGVFVLILVSAYVFQHRLHELSQSSYQAAAQRNATLIESLTGIETIKSQGAESLIQSRWERANQYLSALNVKMRSMSATAMYSTATLQQFVSVCVILIGVYLISERQLTMGGMIAATMLAGRALAPAGQIVGLLMQYQGARTAMTSLEQIMAQPVERPEGSHFIQRPEFKGEIEFRHVSFAYPGQQGNSLDDVSFKINPGERVALIGKVGSGKTTLQKLIMGLYQPTAGAILLDGIDMRQLDPADVRRNLGCVSQDITLFYGSLRENITFGMPHARDDAIVAAADIAGLSEFVQRHPQGFDMPVGERGELLSGGQRQGVGIARAVLHNAPLLLLDEPTSAMDFSTEALVTQRMQAFTEGKTVVLVTHRTSMLSFVDRVIVVDQGKIVADGPRERIMQALAAGRISRAA
ncbi:MAG: type I secretion system permease/ATPase [Aquabacterium sp.]|jgi:ATP-binding cassette subfamily C protein LapB|uniref:type I secretion system permease/ATPase n=1 Tax=Aquabacterium sp. TaxID=1872578 RepID=UPI002A363B3B|nr:type I secretion system permease/ATPase [Aquabacterium sp.]MDX9843477.1 type I secretion system permease/ATPase [Aquabacterium sp.]